MTLLERIITILVIVLGTMLTRFLPFLLFPVGKPTPKAIQYLGNVLPGAVFGLLVVYCLKNVSFLTGSHGIPEFISIAPVVVLHLDWGLAAPLIMTKCMKAPPWHGQSDKRPGFPHRDSA